MLLHADRWVWRKKTSREAFFNVTRGSNHHVFRYEFVKCMNLILQSYRYSSRTKNESKEILSCSMPLNTPTHGLPPRNVKCPIENIYII